MSRSVRLALSFLLVAAICAPGIAAAAPAEPAAGTRVAVFEAFSWVQ